MKPTAIAVAAVMPVIAALVLVPACSGQESPESKGDLAQTLLSLTDRYNAAWETLTWDNVAGFHSDDVRYYWRGPPASSSQTECV